jgi:hypothetical protein
MKTNAPLPGSAEQKILEFNETAADSAIQMNLFWAAVTGLSSYVAAIFTTVFEVGGLWRYCWLTICLVMFLLAYFHILLALRHFGNPPQVEAQAPPGSKSSGIERDR